MISGGDFYFACYLYEDSQSRKAAARLSRLFRMICLISRITSEKRLAITS